MIQKRNISTFAIVAALSILLVPSTSQANFNRTQTPGETVGPSARPPIACKIVNTNICTYGNPAIYWEHCEEALVRADIMFKLLHSGPTYLNRGQLFKQGWEKKVGLGQNIRYIQATGGYCYYYKAGKSSGASGRWTWRYDPS